MVETRITLRAGSSDIYLEEEEAPVVKMEGMRVVMIKLMVNLMIKTVLRSRI